MQYRQFGRLDFKASALGFGAMRLPVVDNDSGKIDEEKAIKMIRYAVDNGVNYIDTAWPYHDKKSELFVGKALQDGYRERVKLATKLPCWLVEKRSDMDKYLDQQLKKLQTDYIDFYLLHALNKKQWKKMKELNIFSWIEKAIKQGKIKHIGFSFHDDYETFEEIIDSYDNWDFCQIQYNYLDTVYQAGRKGLKYAADKGLAVVIMEPLRGGRLAARQPDSIQGILNKAETKRTPADWALQWLWNQPEISVVLSGMSTLDQVKENVESAANAGIGNLNSNELKLIDRVSIKYKEISPVDCTGCGYCDPCPNGVNIPGNFKIYNEAHIYDDYKKAKKVYTDDFPEKNRASACIACGICEEHCPQNLKIPSLLEEVHSYFQG